MPTFRVAFCFSLSVAILLVNSFGENRSSEKTVVIDVHTHIFNVNYLPICGIAISRDVPRPVAIVLDKVLTALTDQSDLEEVDALPLISALGDPEEELLRRLSKLELNKRDLEVLREHAVDRMGVMAVPVKPSNLIWEVLRESRILEEPSHGVDALSRGGNIARFILTLTSSEDRVVEMMRHEYPETDLFIHLMMDLERAYNDRPRFGFKRQIDRMVSLSEKSQGKLLTFVAFDPFRRKSSLEMVEYAIGRGAIGVKFYPPSGYSASGNVIPDDDSNNSWKKKQWLSRYQGLKGRDLNYYCERLFEYCAGNDIPIIAHCESGGFEAVEDYGKFSDPDFWIPVLKEHKDLKVCFAHAGGYDAWYGNIDSWLDGCEPNSFEEKVYRLCVEFENAYLEFGYHDLMSVETSRNQFVDNLKRLIEASGEVGSSRPYDLAKKIMFGTDWHMSSKMKDPGSLFDGAVKAFDSQVLESYRTDFFAGNAVRFLGLKALSSNEGKTFKPEQRAYLRRLMNQL